MYIQTLEVTTGTFTSLSSTAVSCTTFSATNLTVTGDVTFSGDIKLTGPITIASNLDMQNTYRVVNLPAPVAATDAANKQYVDSVTGSSPGGANTYVQYNGSGLFAGDAGFTRNVATNLVATTGTLLVGTGTADALPPSLQRKSNLGTSPLALTAGTATPSSLDVQGRVATTNATPTTILAFALQDRSSAYVRATAVGVRTDGGGLGETNTFSIRCRIKRFAAGDGTTVSTITTDFSDAQTAGTTFSCTTSGANHLLQVTGTGGSQITWNCDAYVCVSSAW